MGDFKIEKIEAPSKKDIKENKDKTDTSWLYNKIGIPINKKDLKAKKQKQIESDEKIKLWWDGLTDEEQFAHERDTSGLAGRPEYLTVDEWNALPNYKKAYHAWLNLLPTISTTMGGPWLLPTDTHHPISKGMAIGVKNAMVNAFALPLEIADAAEWTEGMENKFREAISKIDPMQPENSFEEISAIFAQYGFPAMGVMGWLNRKLPAGQGFWKALARYGSVLTSGAASDFVVAGPGDINLSTAFGEHIPLPIPHFFSIHEDDSNLVRRAKIGGEFFYFGPMIDTTLMIAGGMFKFGKRLLGSKQDTIKIYDADGNVIREYSAAESSWNAVRGVLQSISDGPRTADQIEEGLRLFADTGILPPTGSVSGNEGLIALQKMFSASEYSDVALKNLLALNKNMDDILKAAGFKDGVSSTFLSKEIDGQLAKLTDEISTTEKAIDLLKREKDLATGTEKLKFDEQITAARNKLKDIEENRALVERTAKEEFSEKFQAAKEEVRGYIDSIGLHDSSISGQLAKELDDELINQLTYLKLYKNELYASIDTVGVPLKNFKTGGKNRHGQDETVVDILQKDIEFFINKRNADDFLFEEIPKKLKKELKYLYSSSRSDQPITLKILEEKRKVITEAWKKAIDNGDLQLAKRISDARKAIFDNLYYHIGKNTDKEYADIAKRAKDTTRWFASQYAPRFEQGIGMTWANAFKKRKSGSVLSSSPEQSVNYFLLQNNKGKRIVNSPEYAINQLNNIINPPKDELGQPLIKPIIDPTTNKPLNITDAENVHKIVENWMAAQVAKNLRGQTNVNKSLTILEKMKDDFSAILTKYPKIAKSLDDYIESIKSREFAVDIRKTELDEVKQIEKEITANEKRDQKKIISSLTEEKKQSLSHINASFSEKIQLANDALNLTSNKRKDALSLFSYFTNKRPEQAIDDVMNSADPVKAMEDLRQTVNDLNISEVMDGFNDSVSLWLKNQVEAEKRILTSANVVYPTGTTGPLFAPDLQALDAILKDKKTLQALEAAGWTTKNVDDLTKLGEMLAVLERGKVSTKTIGGKTEVVDPSNVLLKSRIILASIYGIVKGRGIFAISDFVMKAMGHNPRKGAMDVLDHAMTDPKLAEILLMPENPYSRKLLNTYITQNIADPVGDALTEEKFDYEIEKISPNENTIEPQTKTFTPPFVPTIPGANAESRMAKANIVPPLDTGMIPAEVPAAEFQTAGAGSADTYAKGVELFGKNPREITFANQGGIMSTNKAFQRVA